MYFLTLDAELLKDKTLSSSQKIILGLVYSLNSQDKECFASVRALSDMLGLTYVNISKNINVLINRGLLISYTKNHKRYLKVKDKIYIANYKPIDAETIQALENFKDKFRPKNK